MSMMEKAMYLKGLCEGLELDKTTKEGKLLSALLEMVTEMAEEIDDLQEQIDEQHRRIEDIDRRIETLRGELDSLHKPQDMPIELLDVLHELELHIDVFPTVEELCDMLFVTSSTALRLFRRYLGVSPRQFLEIRRLDIGRRHLREGKSVTDTALLVGYADPSAFIRLFRQRFGITPLKYSQTGIVEYPNPDD